MAYAYAVGCVTRAQGHDNLDLCEWYRVTRTNSISYPDLCEWYSGTKGLRLLALVTSTYVNGTEIPVSQGVKGHDNLDLCEWYRSTSITRGLGLLELIALVTSTYVNGTEIPGSQGFRVTSISRVSNLDLREWYSITWVYRGS